MTDANRQLNIWEKIKILSSVIAAVIIPIAIVYIGNAYTTAIKERELQGRFVELAIDILRNENLDQESEMRLWAIEIVDKYSGVPLTENGREQLKLKGLPSSRHFTSYHDLSKSDAAAIGESLRHCEATDIKITKQSNGKYMLSAYLYPNLWCVGNIVRHD